MLVAGNWLLNVNNLLPGKAGMQVTKMARWLFTSNFLEVELSSLVFTLLKLAVKFFLADFRVAAGFVQFFLNNFLAIWVGTDGLDMSNDGSSGSSLDFFSPGFRINPDFTAARTEIGGGGGNQVV